MARFLVLTTFTSHEARMEYRAVHREYLYALVDQGKILMAGPYEDESGGLIIFEAESEQEVRDLVANDPFTTGGVFATTEIRPWKLVAGR